MTQQRYRFCIVDDDNLLEPGYLANGIQFLDENADVALIAGRTLPRFPDNVCPPADFEERYAALLACHDKGEQLLWNETPAGAGQMGRTFLMRGIYEHIGTRRIVLEALVAVKILKGRSASGWDWRTACSSAAAAISSARRLCQYIDGIVTCAAISTGPWLRFIAGIEPRAATWHWLQVLQDWCRALKYRLLLFFPPSIHPKLKRAPFWQRFYEARAKGYLSLILDRRNILAMLTSIESSVPLLSPSDGPEMRSKSSALKTGRPGPV
ncbi:MAG: hypothetical protein U0936_03275 [Planctomycetaceae bacterium]